jgi:NTE family protein
MSIKQKLENKESLITEKILKEIRLSKTSITEAIKLLRTDYKIALSEAKKIINASGLWSKSPSIKMPNEDKLSSLNIKTTIQSLSKKYDQVAVVLQGGGALGSYQAGVFEGLSESGIEPDWIAGISIGALNTAIIAGNKPENRVKALRDFWDTICQTNSSPFHLDSFNEFVKNMSNNSRKVLSGYEALKTMMSGQKGFFNKRFPLPVPFIHLNTPDKISYYKTENLKETLLKFADFDMINNGKMRVSVGAVNIKTGNFTYFDNSKIILKPEHFMASGSLPPGFPAVEIDGEYYWDGGLVSNTPLAEILDEKNTKNTLVFQIDLWSSTGRLPENFFDITERTKDIQFSSRTRLVTDMIARRQKNRKIIKELLKHISPNIKKDNVWCKKAEELAQDVVTNIIQLIYKDKSYEGHYKDYEFSRPTMHEHWSSGLTDIRETFKNKSWLDLPSPEKGFVTHDIHRGTSRD